MEFEFAESEQLEEFLADKPPQWSHLIAARAALRVLPLALSGLRERHRFPILRACFISWAACKFPTQDMTYAARSATPSASSAVNAAAFSNRSIRSTFSSDAAARSVALFVNSTAPSVAHLAAFSVRSAVSALSADFAARSAAWKAISTDAFELTSQSTSRYFVELALSPLWSGRTPAFVVRPWRTVAAGEWATHYAPWINWYQALLTGNGPSADYFGPGLTLRIAQQPDEWWKRPAAKVTADISVWLGERENNKDKLMKEMDEVQKQLIQRPAAASFGWTDDQLSVNAPVPLPPASLAQDFLNEVRLKAVDLRDRLAMTNAAHRVRNSLNGVIAILPEQATDLRPGLLRSRARSVHADATAYAGQFQDGELPVDATAMLLDLSGGLRDLEGCFPELREIEKEIAALNLKPADVPAVQKHLEEINKVASASPVVAENAKIVMAAGTETMKAEATPDITEVRTAEQALTTRNLVNAALQRSIQQILSRLPDTTGRVYDETEKAGLNLIRPAASVGASVLVASLVNPIAGLALFALAEYDRLPGIINFIKEAKKQVGPSEGDLE